jgi:hypothetical protein
MKKPAFWDMAPCSLVEIDLRFKGRSTSTRLHGTKIVNSLPSSLTSLVNKKSQFKVALKMYLNTHSFYCVDEFLMFENNAWCIYKRFLVFIYYKWVA